MNKKRIISVLLIFAFVFAQLVITVQADERVDVTREEVIENPPINENVIAQTDDSNTAETIQEEKTAEILQIGDYFTLGKYNDEPIVWSYMADDEHGKLIVSDKIICVKPFGDNKDNNNFWEESFIRKWLNSSVCDGEIDWSQYVPDWADYYMDYSEGGFLNKKNFTINEKGIIKPVSQWCMLPESHLELSENGVYTAYSAIKERIPGRPQDGGKDIMYTFSELPSAYYGAAHCVTDSMFLLDEMQICNVLKNFTDLRAKCGHGAYMVGIEFDDGYLGYSLRTPTGEVNTCIDEYNIYYTNVYIDGIRPAFYLDEENAYIKSGSGTVDDPYIMDGKEKTVYINNVKAEIEEPPVTVEGIVMVPMQETFEKLGANVIYDEETQAVTAELDGKYIYTLTDNKGILINGECDDMGYPMTMILGKPYVPLSATEKSVTPNVQWNNDLQQLNIWTE